jgi:hypothetical protein
MAQHSLDASNLPHPLGDSLGQLAGIAAFGIIQY